MSDEIREGDRFLVEVEVSSFPNHVCALVVCVGGTLPPKRDRSIVALWNEELKASKRLPRSIKVGERVKDENGWLGVVVAINTERAWVDWVEGGAGIRRLSNLTLATGETP